MYNEKKSSFLPPPLNQILCSKPKELYLIDLTELPENFLITIKQENYILLPVLTIFQNMQRLI